MRYRNLIFLPVAAISYSVHAETYLSTQQAQQVIFPGETFIQQPVSLKKDQEKQIKERSGVTVRDKNIQLWKTSKGSWFFVDRVIGKHEFITYAVGLTSDGSVKQVEIMEYKETYGYQVREKKWLAQFTGKDSPSEIKFDDDVKNISGATLSSRNISNGVKRILATFDVAIKGAY